MHSKLATHTGIHMAGVVSFCLVLLIGSIVLPVILGWPLTLTLTQRADNNLAVGQLNSLEPTGQVAAPPLSDGEMTPDSAANQTQLYQDEGSDEMTGDPEAGVDGQSAVPELQGSVAESRHLYKGSERIIVFTPRKLTDPRKSQIQIAALLAGPILISGTPLAVYGTGEGADGATKANISLELTNGRIFWFSALALLLLLLIADLLLGDIYAMQKILFTLEIIWILYSLAIGWIASNYMQDFVARLFPDVNMHMTLSGIMTAPVKIGFIGLIYWMFSMLLRSLHEERTAAKAEKRRLAAEMET
jgi:hypothetical protein